MELEVQGAAEAAPATDIAATPEAPAEVTSPEPVKSWEESADADLKAVWNKHHPVRDEHGRFASTKEPSADVPPPPGEDTPIQEGQSPTETTEKPAEEPAIPAPQSLPAELKAHWDASPPEMRAFLAKREQETQAKISEQGRQIKASEPIRQTIERYRDQFEKHGVSELEGLDLVLQANARLDANPWEGIQWLAQAYGIDLSQLATGQTNGNGDASALHQRISQLESQLRDQSNRDRQREESERTTRTKSLESLIEKFSEDKSDFAELEGEIVAEIEALKVSSPELVSTPSELISKAYDRARWASPQHRQRLLDEQMKAAEAKREAEAKKRAEDARNAKAVNVRSTPADVRRPVSMDQTMRETYRRVQAT